jgi:hypothetical protein
MRKDTFVDRRIARAHNCDVELQAAPEARGDLLSDTISALRCGDLAASVMLCAPSSGTTAASIGQLATDSPIRVLPTPPLRNRPQPRATAGAHPPFLILNPEAPMTLHRRDMLKSGTAAIAAVNCLDPDSFRYTIRASEVTA